MVSGVRNSCAMSAPLPSRPHGGGRRLAKGSPEYALVRRWIATGTPRTPTDAPTLARVRVSPTAVDAAFQQAVRLTVTAHYSDDTTEDVTKLAAFQSNDSGYAAVDATGTIRVGTIAGEAAITARFADKFAVCRVLVPLPGAVEPGEGGSSAPEKMADMAAIIPRASQCCFHNCDGANVLSLLPCLMNKKIHMGLQEATCAKLDDPSCHSISFPGVGYMQTLQHEIML